MPLATLARGARAGELPTPPQEDLYSPRPALKNLRRTFYAVNVMAAVVWSMNANGQGHVYLTLLG